MSNPSRRGEGGSGSRGRSGINWGLLGAAAGSLLLGASSLLRPLWIGLRYGWGAPYRQPLSGGWAGRQVRGDELMTPAEALAGWNLALSLGALAIGAWLLWRALPRRGAGTST